MPGLESSFLARFSDLGARNKAAQARQAKGSLEGQMAFSESGWCLAHAAVVSAADRVKVQCPVALAIYLLLACLLLAFIYQ